MKVFTSDIDPAYIIECYRNGYAYQYCGEYVTIGEVPANIRNELAPEAYKILGLEYTPISETISNSVGAVDFEQ